MRKKKWAVGAVLFLAWMAFLTAEANLGVVYQLVLTSGNRTPTIQETYDTWWECEQARIGIERQTSSTGQCQRVPSLQEQKPCVGRS